MIYSNTTNTIYVKIPQYISGRPIIMINSATFALRLAKLRTQKNMSARDMSICLGQNPAYINNIETGKALPSMAMFFKICEYLEITPNDFFNDNIESPTALDKLYEQFNNLSANQINLLSDFIKSFNK